MGWLILEALQKLWLEWNIRGVVLVSLSLQIFLIVLAPFRKHTNNFGLFLWLFYLVADYVANFGIGFIFKNQDKTTRSDPNNHLMAFWGPFLLLHLGGPDTITAFALEDNELWLRHFQGLLFQAFAAAYVFFLTIPGNTLWLPTVLMFLAGIIKYAERTRALFLANMKTFKKSMFPDPDPGPNYAKLTDEHSSKHEAGLPTRIVTVKEPDPAHRIKIGAPGNPTNTEYESLLTDFEVVNKAYDLFEKYRGIIVDMIFSFGEREESRSFFRSRSAEDALRVIEVELSYMYEAFFTKASVLRCKKGYFFRFVSFCFSVTAFGLFVSQVNDKLSGYIVAGIGKVLSSILTTKGSFFPQIGLLNAVPPMSTKIRTTDNKTEFNEFDVNVTMVLMYGALALEALSLLMLFFSERTVVRSNKVTILVRTFNIERLLTLRRPSWSKPKKGPYKNYEALSTHIMFRRWSGKISGHNLITYCLRKWPREGPKEHFIKIMGCLGGRDSIEVWMYKKNNPLLKGLWIFIFDELVRKSKEAKDLKTTESLCSARGGWALQNGNMDEQEQKKLKTYVDKNEVAFDQCLLTWHIATHLCYAKGEELGQEGDIDNYRQFSKLLADYMLYLLVMQTTIMSPVAGIGQIRFQDTCAEAEKFFSKRNLDKKDKEKSACEKLGGVKTEFTPSEVKGDRSKSVLFDACRLAKVVLELEAKKKWVITSQIWVELLSYAACNCRPPDLVQQLSKGGELISFVWLLMFHLGLGKQFQIEGGHARAKLIVDK